MRCIYNVRYKNTYTPRHSQVVKGGLTDDQCWNPRLGTSQCDADRWIYPRQGCNLQKDFIFRSNDGWHCLQVHRFQHENWTEDKNLTSSSRIRWSIDLCSLSNTETVPRLPRRVCISSAVLGSDSAVAWIQKQVDKFNIFSSVTYKYPT